MDPKVVRRAIELGLLDASEADTFLRGDRPPAKPVAVPSTVPPPERLVLIKRPDGRIKRARQQLTKRLVAAGVIHRTKPHPRPRSKRESA